MAFVTRDGSSKIIGVFAIEQTPGQEFLADSDPDVLGFFNPAITLSGARKAKIAELKAFRDDFTKPHTKLMFTGATTEISPALPVLVRDKSMNGANSARDRMGINGTSEIEWYFDDGTDATQRTELIISSGATNQLLKQLVNRDLDNLKMYHKKEAEIFALATVGDIDAYDVSVDALDATAWPT